MCSSRELGVPLVEGRDLLVRDDQVYTKATAGLQAVDVIYRPDSLLGVPGLMRAHRAGTPQPKPSDDRPSR